MNLFSVLLLVAVIGLIALIVVVVRGGAVDRTKASAAIDVAAGNVGNEAEDAAKAAGGFLARLFGRKP